MKRKLFFVSVCIVAFALILSGCIGSNIDEQQTGEKQTSEPQNSEIVTHSSDASPTQVTSVTEPNTPSLDTEQSSVAAEPSVNNAAPTETSNTQQSEVSDTQQSEVSDTQQTEENTDPEESSVKKLHLQIGNNNFTATLESNAAVDALVNMMQKDPLVIQMRDFSGFEKVGSLGESLPTENKQTTTQSGDIVLYNGNQIVIFYGSNSWSYTRLGKIDDLSGWRTALGSGDVTVTFSID